MSSPRSANLESRFAMRNFRQNYHNLSSNLDTSNVNKNYNNVKVNLYQEVLSVQSQRGNPLSRSSDFSMNGMSGEILSSNQHNKKSNMKSFKEYMQIQKSPHLDFNKKLSQRCNSAHRDLNYESMMGSHMHGFRSSERRDIKYPMPADTYTSPQRAPNWQQQNPYVINSPSYIQSPSQVYQNYVSCLMISIIDWVI